MLNIPVSTVAWIILKAREFDAKDVGSNASGETDEDNPLSVLADQPDDPTVQELTSWIDDLNETESAELIALFWLGRDSGDADEWRELVSEARRSAGRSASSYLLGSPMLGDYLEEGLEILGYDTSEIESSLA